jgi:hypothetical protein
MPTVMPMQEARQKTGPVKTSPVRLTMPNTPVHTLHEPATLKQKTYFQSFEPLQ